MGLGLIRLLRKLLPILEPDLKKINYNFDEVEKILVNNNELKAYKYTDKINNLWRAILSEIILKDWLIDMNDEIG